MRALVINPKGGSGKSLIAREVLAAPLLKGAVIIEIDQLNRQQIDFRDSFLDVVELLPSQASECTHFLKNEHNRNVIIDVGIDKIEETFTKLSKIPMRYIDVVVIPVMPGRYEAEGAFQIYDKVAQLDTEVVFALNQVDPTRQNPLERQHLGFFSRLDAKGMSLDRINLVQIPYSSVFEEAVYGSKTVYQLAYRDSFLDQLMEEEMKNGLSDHACALANAEWNRIAAKSLLDSWIMPAHTTIRRIAGDDI